jgi:hypothetical protein
VFEWIELAETRLRVMLLATVTPFAPLKAMVLAAPAAVPPMVLLAVPGLNWLTSTPLPPLPSALTPSACVPMKLP